ncbi:unnamed protein product [Brachionus calyciflorus]|uniref:Polyadenylate-binding protein n=1 Tax=Brachionus calyciflorus TaxID=104777 RepID=A0A814HTY9_9BILA|nr:unnamed protein product [Brachionus calyciflorus]
MATPSATATSTAQPNYPLASLYVGDLDSDITEAQLYERFSAAGQVLSIRVCRDQITKQSLGYAYVNFNQPADAERALDTMNFDNLSGRPMRIMWSQRDPALRKSGVGNVFIKNLDKSIDNKALYDTFSTFGNILSCKIIIDETGQSKGYGFVHFETNEAAEQAIKAVNNMLLNDKKVFVGKFLSKNQRVESSTAKKFTNVYVKNFGEQINDDEFRQLFEKYGEVTSCVVVRDMEGKSKGFGFVNFREPESAESACKELNESELNGRKIYVGRFQKKAERSTVLRRIHEEKKQERNNRYMGINLYIKNLDDTIDDDKLRQEFVSFGTITSAKVMTENGRSKGFGFVCFSAPEEATKAVTDMNGRIVGTKPLYVALAQRKEDRKHHLATQYMQRITTSRLQNQQMGAVFPPAAASGIYLPSIQNAGGRFYPAAGGFPGQVRPTPRWAGQTRAQTPGNTYQNYQMINTGQQRPRLPFNPSMIRPTNVNGNQQQQQQPRQQLAQQVQPKLNRPTQPGQVVQTQAINVPGQEPLTAAMLSAAQPQEQKQLLGERLYPLIYTMHPEWAGKITGMLLEIDNAELLHMLESRESLKAKVDEAVIVLQAHQSRQQQQQQNGN